MALKSSYELAMERLGKTLGPERKLTSEQKKRLAEIDAFYKAKIAELELAFRDKIVAARAAEDHQALHHSETVVFATTCLGAEL